MYIRIWSTYITPQNWAKIDQKWAQKSKTVRFWPKFEISIAQTDGVFYSDQIIYSDNPKRPKTSILVSFWPKFEISSAQTFLKFYVDILQNVFFLLNDEILLENAIFRLSIWPILGINRVWDNFRAITYQNMAEWNCNRQQKWYEIYKLFLRCWAVSA